MQLIDSIFNQSEMRNINGRWVRVLSEGSYVNVRKSTGEHRRKLIDLTALQNGIIPDVFVGFIQRGGTINSQIRILDSQITVVGLDIIGKSLAAFAARHGIGTLIGADEFEQYGEELGRDIRLIYPGTDFVFKSFSITEENVSELIPEGTSFVVSGMESVQAKYVIQKRCKILDIPFLCLMVSDISAAIVPIFPDTADIAGRFESLSVGTNPEDLESKQRLNIVQYANEEILKLLVYGMTNLRGGMLFMDFRSGLITPMSM